jgi:hypothetical protein
MLCHCFSYEESYTLANIIRSNGFIFAAASVYIVSEIADDKIIFTTVSRFMISVFLWLHGNIMVVNLVAVLPFQT